MKYLGIITFVILMLSALVYAISLNVDNQPHDTEYVSIQHGGEHLILEIPEEFSLIDHDIVACYRSNDTIRMEFPNSKTSKEVH